MNTSIKNNLKQLKKRDKFKFSLISNSNQKTEYNLPKASEKQLRDIRKRLKKERSLWWFNAILLTLFSITFIGFLVFSVINITF